jgi:undecaprenyl-diphosphatase
MSIPVILGAGLKSATDVSVWDKSVVPLLLLGFIAAVVSGYLSVRFLLKYLSNHSLNPFGWYRLIMGCLILIWFLSLFLR